MFAFGLPGRLGLGQAFFFRGSPVRLGLGQALLRFGAQLRLDRGDHGGGVERLGHFGLVLGGAVNLQVEEGRRRRHVVAVGVVPQDANAEGMDAGGFVRRDEMKVVQVRDHERPGIVPIVGAGREGGPDGHALDDQRHLALQAPFGQFLLDSKGNCDGLVAHDTDGLLYIVS